jgi:hypothetical protein
MDTSWRFAPAAVVLLALVATPVDPPAWDQVRHLQG